MPCIFSWGTYYDHFSEAIYAIIDVRMKAPTVEDIPGSFFKYRPLGGDPAQMKWLIDTITDDRLYWPSPLQFNDPFDCVPIYRSPAGKALRKFAARLHKKNEPHSSRKARRVFLRQSLGRNPRDVGVEMQEGMNKLLDKTAVYSLAVVPDDILMWSHYANSHQGVCLRFNGMAFTRQFVTGYPVRYSKERPLIKIGSEDATDVLEKLLLTKAEMWAYEQEWRFIDYMGGSGLRRFRPVALTGLIIGSRTPSALSDELMRACEARRTPISLFRAVCDNAEFRLNLMPINETARAE